MSLEVLRREFPGYVALFLWLLHGLLTVVLR